MADERQQMHQPPPQILFRNGMPVAGTAYTFPKGLLVLFWMMYGLLGIPGAFFLLCFTTIYASGSLQQGLFHSDADRVIFILTMLMFLFGAVTNRVMLVFIQHVRKPSFLMLALCWHTIPFAIALLFFIRSNESSATRLINLYGPLMSIAIGMPMLPYNVLLVIATIWYIRWTRACVPSSS